jgi:hypothetical protein
VCGGKAARPPIFPYLLRRYSLIIRPLPVCASGLLLCNKKPPEDQGAFCLAAPDAYGEVASGTAMNPIDPHTDLSVSTFTSGGQLRRTGHDEPAPRLT